MIFFFKLIGEFVCRAFGLWYSGGKMSPHSRRAADRRGQRPPERTIRALGSGFCLGNASCARLRPGKLNPPAPLPQGRIYKCHSGHNNKSQLTFIHYTAASSADRLYTQLASFPFKEEKRTINMLCANPCGPV